LKRPRKLPTPRSTSYAARLGEFLSPADLEQVVAAGTSEPRTAFRVNTLRARVEDVRAELEREGFELRELDWRGDAFHVAHEARRALTESAAVREGRIWIQNPSSMLPATVLDARPDERVLDLCAAPGSKTLQLACMMQGRGHLAAVESSKPRFFRMKANFESQGARFVRTYLKDGAHVWRAVPEFFDRVLVDAPCSGEGRFRAGEEEPDTSWSERKIKRLAGKQRRLLESALHALRPGGDLVYSTCTLAPEENEGVVSGLLGDFAGAVQVEELRGPLPESRPGLAAWRGEEFAPEVTRARRILPDGLYEGFFVCHLKKCAPTVPES
jgi:NOL1/NOP2/sun family putative RNA methylase